MRNLTSLQIDILENQGCSADGWNNVIIDDFDDIYYLKNVRFSGKVSIGKQNKTFVLAGGVERHSGVYNAELHNCNVGSDVLIENINGYVANYEIGDGVIIRNTDSIFIEGECSFGNGVEVRVLNEGGGREVLISDKLSSHVAYMWALYRYYPQLIDKLKGMTVRYADTIKSCMGQIGKDTVIEGCGILRNVKIGRNCRLEGVLRLCNGSVNGDGGALSFVGHGVVAEDFIISSGAVVKNGTVLKRCFVGQACRLINYTAVDSLFFADCDMENGEACSLFAGVYTVSHHKNTLLIAGMYSFMNAGSGTNQSNHNYKLGALSQGIMERGCKTGSDAYVLLPARVGAYTFVGGRHYSNPDISDIPFSYLTEHEGKSYLSPAATLANVGTIRDAMKFPNRDKRTGEGNLESINFEMFSPYSVQKVLNALKILKTIGNDDEEAIYNDCIIKKSALERGKELYELAIDKYLGDVLIKRLTGSVLTSNDELRMHLRPLGNIGAGDWLDVGGEYLPKSKVREVISQIENDKITQIEDVNAFFASVHASYEEMEWVWAWNVISERYGVDLENVDAEKIISIIENHWKVAEKELFEKIKADASKEFSAKSKISYGADGDEADRDDDFAQVRGNFENNDFIKQLKAAEKDRTDLYKSVISCLKNI
ncbi:MAG: DUF4954 family protein [Culturomica sp.]|jgi:carbonic anhydrase/acetyltransferase-like protein (isoleucine patch superfamily)|nr:DUF4954 family protein [Culturomica sp.]